MANNYPIFIGTAGSTGNGYARLTAANTTVGMTAGSTAGAALLWTAGPSGSRIDEIRVHGLGQSGGTAPSSMLIRLYLNDGVSTNYTLFDEQPLPTASRTSSAVGPSLTIPYPGGLIIPNGFNLYVAQSVYAGSQDQNDVYARGGHF